MKMRKPKWATELEAYKHYHVGCPKSGCEILEILSMMNHAFHHAAAECHYPVDSSPRPSSIPPQPCAVDEKFIEEKAKQMWESIPAETPLPVALLILLKVLQNVYARFNSKGWPEHPAMGTSRDGY
jgi:hypothetical protein